VALCPDRARATSAATEQSRPVSSKRIDAPGGGGHLLPGRPQEQEGRDREQQEPDADQDAGPGRGQQRDEIAEPDRTGGLADRVDRREQSAREATGHRDEHR
jgi:hypothetical protein